MPMRYIKLGGHVSESARLNRQSDLTTRLGSQGWKGGSTWTGKTSSYLTCAPPFSDIIN